MDTTCWEGKPVNGGVRKFQRLEETGVYFQSLRLLKGNCLCGTCRIMSAKLQRPMSASSLTAMAAKSPKRQERQTNFKVIVRVRPPLPREVSFQNIVAVDEREQTITISENLEAVLDDQGQVVANPGPYVTHTFVFDHVYNQHATQKQVYETTARTVVESALQGYNATIFAYGQTGTGKTYTM